MSVIEIGQRNIAPSCEDPKHDVYVFSIELGSARPFWLEQSIHGGHADRGGCIMLALHELDGWRGDWRLHLTHAGCAWAIPLLEEALRNGDVQAAIDAIVARVRVPG